MVQLLSGSTFRQSVSGHQLVWVSVLISCIAATATASSGTMAPARIGVYTGRAQRRAQLPVREVCVLEGCNMGSIWAHTTQMHLATAVGTVPCHNAIIPIRSCRELASMGLDLGS